VREFETAIKEVVEADEDGLLPGDVEFKVDGQRLVAHQPSDGQIIYLMANTAKNSSMQQQVAGAINFFTAVLDEKSKPYVIDRLLDYEDDFGIEQVQDIMEFLIEEWSGGRPTKSPSASSQSRRSGGQKSTRRTPASKSSASRSTDS